MPSDVLTVRLAPGVREVLAREAATHDAAGASALARDILEDWAAQADRAAREAGIASAVSYLRELPDGWGDEPETFFRMKR